MSKQSVSLSGNASHRAAQALALDLMGRVSDTQLKRAGITRQQYIDGCRQLAGYASHAVTMPAWIGPRYDSKGQTLWGRPKPATASKPAGLPARGGRKTTAGKPAGKTTAATRTTRSNGQKTSGSASQRAPKVPGASPATMPARKPATPAPATVSA